jgi:hypothetical protein
MFYAIRTCTSDETSEQFSGATLLILIYILQELYKDRLEMFEGGFPEHLDCKATEVSETKLAGALFYIHSDFTNETLSWLTISELFSSE